jgi:acyl-coenzyme A synthetase/AMP-(fatty) acid ligase
MIDCPHLYFRIPEHNIRIICNAAGPLPHTVAVELQRIFQAAVLPSYGMTECMPISAPHLEYDLEHPGTSGRAIGPQLNIMDDQGNLLPPMSTGEIVVKGCPVFEG